MVSCSMPDLSSEICEKISLRISFWSEIKDNKQSNCVSAIIHSGSGAKFPSERLNLPILFCPFQEGKALSSNNFISIEKRKREKFFSFFPSFVLLTRV